MNIKNLIIVCLILPLSSCFMVQKSDLIPSQQPYDKNTNARIRLYGPYGDALIKRYSDTTCDVWRLGAGSKLHHRFNNGTPRKIRNISLGMPATERSMNALNDTGVMYRDSFKEYAVDAGKPVVLDAGMSVKLDNYSKSCRIAISFTPKAGQDYEASYIEQNGKCSIQVKEIQSPNNQSKIAPTKIVENIQSCS